jgi:hypothetical protein
MTVSESVRAKAERLLVGGHIKVICTDGGIAATVVADHDTYRLVREPDRWRCLCPARGTCAHAVAITLVAHIEEAACP